METELQATDLSSFRSSFSAAWFSDGLILARNDRLFSWTTSTPEWQYRCDSNVQQLEATSVDRWCSG